MQNARIFLTFCGTILNVRVGTYLPYLLTVFIKRKDDLIMQKTASVNTRVDPVLKEQAESILDELGMSMATAMNLFLKQIVIHNGIPFDLRIPKAKPIAYEALTDDEFNNLMDNAAKSYADGKGISLTNFEKQLSEDIGL